MGEDTTVLVISCLYKNTRIYYVLYVQAVENFKSFEWLQVYLSNLKKNQSFTYNKDLAMKIANWQNKMYIPIHGIKEIIHDNELLLTADGKIAYMSYDEYYKK